MSISVKEAMKLKQFKQMRLVAGEEGLDHKIDRIGILDFEIVEGIIGGFYEGDFVLTTFTAARDDQRQMEQCIKDLITCNVSALAIKTIYYDMLSLDIIKYANKKKLPIFLFDEHVYFEYIIEDLMAGMHARSRMALMSSKIELLFKNELKKQVVAELAYEINSNFLDQHICVYFKEKNYRSEDKILKYAERFQRSSYRSQHHSLINYQEGMVLFLTYQHITERGISLDIKHVIKEHGIAEEDYHIGFSEIRSSISEVHRSIRESIYAAQSCSFLGQVSKHYKDIGIYKVILPNTDNTWFNEFSSSIIDTIKRYDDGKLLKTAEVYIEMDGDAKQTSEAMFQHINTIRYRIKKLQEIMNEPVHNRFYEQLALAIKFRNVIER